MFPLSVSQAVTSNRGTQKPQTFFNTGNLDWSKHNDLGSLNSWDREFFLFPFKFSALETFPQVKFLGKSLWLSSGNRRAQNFILRRGVATFLPPPHPPPAAAEDAPIEVTTEMEIPQEIAKVGNTDVKKHSTSTLKVLQIQLGLFPGTLNSCEEVSDWFFGCYHCTDRQGDPTLGTGILKSLYRFEASLL